MLTKHPYSVKYSITGLCLLSLDEMCQTCHKYENNMTLISTKIMKT